MIDLSFNDAVTGIAAVLSGIIFPYLSKQAKDLKEQQKGQMDILIDQNKKLLDHLQSITDKALDAAIEKKTDANH